MCSGFEAGSCVRLVDFVYHSTLGLRVIKKKKKYSFAARAHSGCLHPQHDADTGVNGAVESGPLRAVHLSRHKWPGRLVN